MEPPKLSLSEELKFVEPATDPRQSLALLLLTVVAAEVKDSKQSDKAPSWSNKYVATAMEWDKLSEIPV